MKQKYAVSATPSIIAEWNQNRYTTVASITNTDGASISEATDGYDVENFPIETIAAVNRPETNGIVKARVGYSNTDSSWIVKDGFQTNPGSARYYTVGKDDPYKYWCSPVPSSFGTGGGYGFTKTVQPTIIYSESCNVNKIKVLMETSSAKPTSFSIDITTNGSSWTTISVNPTVAADGSVVLYFGPSGWSSVVNRDYMTQIRGLRLNVFAMNKNSSFFNLIELSPRLEKDITADIISFSSEFSMSETSFVTPLGKASSNTASVVLANFDEKYNTDNSSSIYYGIIDKNVKFTAYLNIDATEVGSGIESIKMFSMFADSWDGQETENVTVNLKDYSLFMQQIKPRRCFYENITIGEAVWILCDMIGFTSYIFETAATADAVLIPFFWTSGDETIWDIFSRIAEMTQTAIYFDADGFLRIKTRDAAYNLAKGIDWPLDAVPNGSKLPDIVELSQSNNYEANTVKVNYKTTKVSDDNNGFPQMETVWNAPDDLTLRSSALTSALTTSSTFFMLSAADATIWPFTGVVQLDGEFIRYEGKGYYYYDMNNVRRLQYVKSLDEQNQIDKNLSGTFYKYKNAYSGHMLIKKRGEFNTNNVNHPINVATWYNRHCGEQMAYPAITWNAGIIQNAVNSTIELAATTSRFDAHNWYLSTHGNPADQACTYFGTRIYFGSGGYTQGLGGLVFWNNNTSGSAESGYYVELIKTTALGKDGEGRKFHNELNFYSITGSGVLTRYGPNNGLGIPMAIDEHVWYDIDVFARSTSGGDSFSIMINGVPAMNVTVPAGHRIMPTGRHGVFTRGNTRLAFEYFYAVNGVESAIQDEGSFFDKIRGGWVSGQWDRAWTYNWTQKSRLVGKTVVNYQQLANQRFFDDFGPYAHEVREFAIDFDKAPVQHSQLLITNDYQAFCPEYNADAFGAKFILANHSRYNAVMQGSDTLTYGVNNEVTQQTLIYGRVVYQEDESNIIVTDENSVRARGTIDIEISGDLSQSKASAQALGDWIIKHWGQPNDEVNVTIFGNPLFELGDKVSVNYPEKNFFANTHVYFVIAISHQFDEGFETTLTLRRCRLT